MAQMPQPQVGERRQFGESIGEWDGRQWVEAVDAAPPESGGVIKGLMSTLGDVGTGVAKGVGQTVTDLGSLARQVPGVSKLDSIMTPFEFPVEPTNMAQSFGKGAEQVGEFLLPGRTVGKAITSGLVRRIPNAASPRAMSMMNKGAALTGRIVGEGASAAGVGALHGDENVDDEALIASGGTAAGEGMAALIPAMLKNPVLRKALPVLLATAAGGAGFGIPGAGVGATMAMFGVKRSLADDLVKAMSTKTGTDLVRRGSRAVGRKGGAAAAGIKSESDQANAGPQRRRMAP